MRRILIAVLLLPLVLASPLDSDEHDMSVNLSNTVQIEPDSPNYDVETIEARLSWYPRESYRQDVRSLSFTPDAERNGDAVFRWTDPLERELELGFTAGATASNKHYPVEDDHDFPTEAPEDLERYTEPQEIINVNDEIRRRAAVITKDADTVYEAATALAEWTQENINYSLTTVTEDASKQSSWVLRNQRGVCDELTALFISMARSLDIPARFVYGQAYTNVQDTWGPHGWAEIYIPEEGWVPFDPTYGLYGRLSGTHTTMGRAVDANKPTIEYTTRARNAQIRNGPLRMDVMSTEARNNTPGLTINAEPRLSTVGLDGSNVIDVTVTNQDPIYKPVRVQLLPTTRFDKRAEAVVLGPNSQETVSWQLNMTGLDQGYVYTFPVTVRTGETRVKTSFTAEQGGLSRTLDRPPARTVNATLRCSAPPRLYVNETATLNCTSDTRYCENCYKQVRFNTTGTKQTTLERRTEHGNATGSAQITVVDEPSVLVETDAPTTAPVNEQAELAVNLTPTSSTVPRNVTVTLSFVNRERSFNLSRLDSLETFRFTLHTAGLLYQNRFRLYVTYTDGRNRSYRTDKTFTIDADPASILDHARLALNWLRHTLNTQL